jgi:hypothetical protein
MAMTEPDASPLEPRSRRRAARHLFQGTRGRPDVAQRPVRPAGSQRPQDAPSDEPAPSDRPAGSQRPRQAPAERPAKNQRLPQAPANRPARPAAAAPEPALRRRRQPPASDRAAPSEPERTAGELNPAEDTEDEEGEGRQAKAPWHFKFIVVASVVYLGWRLYQGISWMAHHI